MKRILRVISIALITLCSCANSNEPTPSGTPTTPVKPSEEKKPYDENGALKGRFYISPTKMVRFSRGLLRYDPQKTSDAWSFADDQLSMLSKESSTTKTSKFDRFGWATSGYNNYLPTTNGDRYDYYYQGMVDISGTDYDWGSYNAISNGGNKKGYWRTLRSSEWQYLIDQRPNAYDKLGYAKVNGNLGLVLLPDDWEWKSTEPCPFVATYKYEGKRLQYATDEAYQTYTSSDWKKLEMNGAVFIICDASTWTSTPGKDKSVACSFRFQYDLALNQQNFCYKALSTSGRHMNYFVRLVTDK